MTKQAHQQKKIEEFYDEYVQRQLKVGVNKRHYSILEKLKKAGLKSSHKVLEIGCGIGTFTGLIIKEITSGSVVAMDISGASIKYANDHNTYSNLSYIHADAANHDFGNQQFDVIVMPDVIEHIPLDLHCQLFAKLAQVLKPDGFIFIHIPSPYYLQWAIDQGHETQVIDQPIYTDVLLSNITPANLIVHFLETYSIWIKEGDYQQIVLKHHPKLVEFTHYKESTSLLSKVKAKLSKKF